MQDLDNALLNFENVIAARLPYYLSVSPVARAIREIYVTKSASAVLSCVRAAFSDAVDIICTPPRPDHQSWQRPVLPVLDAIRSATPRLTGAIASRNHTEAIEALEDMGVIALCTCLDQQFSRFEVTVGSIVGRVRLIPLVELAILAAEFASYDKASIYLAEARTLSPSPTGLHDLHTVAGILALSRGNLEEAKECLAESVRVCQRDGFARLTCSTRNQNLMLVERLLDHGQNTIVVCHLKQCLGIWTHDQKRIGGWIEAIRAGKRPDFSEPTIFSRRPEQKMLKLIMIGTYFSETPVEGADRAFPPTMEEILEQIRDEHRRAVKGKLDTSQN